MEKVFFYIDRNGAAEHGELENLDDAEMELIRLGLILFSQYSSEERKIRIQNLLTRLGSKAEVV